MKLPALTGVVGLVATELVTLEHEHRGDAGTCGESFPCVHVRCAWSARELLGWPLPAVAEAVLARV